MQLLESVARNIVEFVCSLNELFWHMSASLPDIDLPWLDLRDVSFG